MECPSCQHENPSDSNFCLKCGGKLERECPSCAKPLPTDASFCNGCGHDLSKPIAPSEARPDSPQPPSSQGERRQATVLFSDLSGYTAMNERLDPEEVTGIMARFKSEAERIVDAHGGIVNQFVGDEVFALFGIPTSHEDDPQRAVRAALELHEAVRALSDDIEARLGETLRLHSGINTGLVVTSADGGDERGGRYAVTGDTINTAARLVSLAETDQILTGDSTRRLVAPFFDLEELEPVSVKGKTRPLVPYRVLAVSGVASRFEAAEARGFTPYTGREMELAALQGCLQKAVEGEGQFVTVSGEAGLGKSRLLYEFRQEIDREAVTVMQGRCQSYGQGTPYLPLVDALRHGLGLREEDDPKQLREKVIANTLAIETELKRYIPHYLHLLSIPSKEHPLPADLAGEALRNALAEAYAAIILENSKRRTCVLVLEDWHWVDEASNSALGYLLKLIGAHCLLVVITYRPEWAGDWSGLGRHTHLALTPLDASQSGRIVRNVLKAETLPQRLGELIQERTGGNPFFIEEMCQDLREEGAIVVKNGQAVLTSSMDKMSLPGNVQAVIRSRLDRLGEKDREVLRFASVIGREFSENLLEKICSFPDGLKTSLNLLKTQQLIQQMQVMPEVQYMFRHVLTQVVVYETLLLERRKSLHGIAGRAIEALYPEWLEEHYETLAHHYSQSDDTEKAIHYLEFAGDKAAKYFSLVEARKHYREAIRLVDAMEVTPERMTIRIDLTLSWAAVAFYSPSEEIINVLETSLSFAEQMGDESRLARIVYWMGRTHFSLGDMARALSVFERCIGIAEALADEELLALPYIIMGRACWYTAEHTKGIEFLEKGVPILERLGNMDEVAYSTSYLGVLHCWTGDFPRGNLLAEKALEIARELGNLTREAQTQSVITFVRIVHGDWAAALDTGTRSMDIAQRIGSVVTVGYGMGWKGIATFMLGQREEGIELMKEGGKLIEATGSHLTLTLIHGWLAESCAASGAVEDAVLYASKVLERGLVSDKVGEAMAHRALAVAASLEIPPDWGRVEDHIEESIHLSQDRGERPNLGICFFRSTEILHKKGDLPEASKQLGKATILFTDMEMTWWLEQAEALRGRLERGDPWKGFAPHGE